MIIKKIKTLEIIKDDDSRDNVYHDGLCTRSTDGSLWRLNVDDSGVIVTEKVTE